ncbi:MAG: hypothetical protein HQ538_04125 [Parcubacteria group bacterium]|nr:hypothetical protein [Parcubacteria group bacterium]
MKIFILEDLPERQEAFRKKFAGYEVKIVDTVIDAIQLLKVESFDLVCLDHDLGGQNGVDFKDPNCGSRVAEFLRDMNYAGQIIIHSLNPIGAANMKAILPNAIVRPSYFQEPFMIDNFSGKKLTEYLKDGMKVLIRWGHGLGDLLMFLESYEKLKKDYPLVNFHLYTESGQEELWGDEKNKDAQDYDLVFSLNFPMAEGSNITKAEKCCIEEIGIEPPVKEIVELSKYDSPFVALHFFGTALPGSVGCSEEVAKQIWQEVKDFGKIPISCHFEHCWHNPVNQKFGFVDISVRGYQAKISNLIGLIQHSFAFIGVASGPFVVALSVMPERTLYLEKSHPLKTYTKKDIAKVDINNYQVGDVTKFLESLKI